MAKLYSSELTLLLNVCIAAGAFSALAILQVLRLMLEKARLE